MKLNFFVYSWKKSLKPPNLNANDKFHKIEVDIRSTTTGLTRIIKFSPSYLLINKTKVNRSLNQTFQNRAKINF